MTGEPLGEVEAYLQALSRVRGAVQRCHPEAEGLADLLRLYRSRALEKAGTICEGLEYNFHGSGCLFTEIDGAEVDVDFLDGELDVFDSWRVRRFAMSVESESSLSLEEIAEACRSFQYFSERGPCGALTAPSADDGCGGWVVKVVDLAAEGVGEEFLDHGEVNALLQEQCCSRVAEVVEATAAEPGPVEEAAGEVGRVERPSSRRGEEEVAVAPGRSGLSPLPVLPLLVLLEGVDAFGGERAMRRSDARVLVGRWVGPRFGCAGARERRPPTSHARRAPASCAGRASAGRDAHG